MSKAKDRHFEHFRPHTGFKHLVLRHYIEAWTRKLLLRPAAGDEVLLLDAFAGVGMDEQGQYGSPIILAKIAAGAEAQLARIRPGREFRIRLVAIEKRAGNYTQLKENLAPFGDRAIARRGTLADYLPELLARDPPTPTMAFLDPCGVDGLDAALVRAILRLDRNEVLARFSDEGALRHFGAVRARRLDAAGGSAEAQAGLTLWGEEDAVVSDPPKEGSERRSVAIETTGARAREILNTAFGGGDWEADLDRFPSGAARRQRLVELYRELLANTGAEYTTAIPIWDDEDHLDASLIHASRSAYGRSTMKEAVERAINQCALPARVKDLIRLDLRVDLQELLRRAREMFEGQTVGWADREPSIPSVRRSVLQETNAFPHQLRDLQRRMTEMGWRASKGRTPTSFKFPEAP